MLSSHAMGNAPVRDLIILKSQKSTTINGPNDEDGEDESPMNEDFSGDGSEEEEEEEEDGVEGSDEELELLHRRVTLLKIKNHNLAIANKIAEAKMAKFDAELRSLRDSYLKIQADAVGHLGTAEMETAAIGGGTAVATADATAAAAVAPSLTTSLSGKRNLGKILIKVGSSESLTDKGVVEGAGERSRERWRVVEAAYSEGAAEEQRRLRTAEETWRRKVTLMFVYAQH